MRRGSRWFWLATVFAAVVVGLAGCGGDDDEGGGASEGGAADEVTLQLKWVTQAQFAGYYAALEKGYYDEEGLDVTVKVGGPDITPEQVVASVLGILFYSAVGLAERLVMRWHPSARIE